VNSEGLAGAEDGAIVQAASASGRILQTLDKGVANLMRYPIHEHRGLVLFRPGASGRRTVLSFVRSRSESLLEPELAGRLIVVGPTRIRIR
jgi:hypothetical protein